MSSIFSFFFGKGHRCTRGAAAHSPFPGGSPFLGTPFSGATELRSNTPFPGWGVSPPLRRERCAAPALGQKGRDTYGFPPSLNSYLSLGNLANEPYGSTS